MSDGNYNRNLLPYHQYASGLRAGKAQMHSKALVAFRQWLEDEGYSKEDTEKALLKLRTYLD